MNLAPVLAAPPLVQAHIALALVALVAGTGVLVAAKGTVFHRRLGAVFSAAMMLVAATSFGIAGLFPGHYSPIHLLSLLTLATLPLAILARRRGNVRAHAAGMILNYAGLAIAGVFTLLPPRVLNAALFGY